MILHADFTRPRLAAWGVFAGVVLVCLAVLWWLADAGDLPTRLEAAKNEQLQMSGKVDLAKRIGEQKQANDTLRKTIERMKAATGFAPTAPFLVPAGHPQPGQYFNEQLAAVQDLCRPKAYARSIQYQERLGFENTAKVPRDEDAPHLLAMLQLTRKAAVIILETPTPVESFRITQPAKQAVVTGPAGRPPLLREYPLRLEVRGRLDDLLWILHRLATPQSEPDGEQDYPLIVRGWRIDSRNLNPNESIKQLDAVFEIAAMRFLSDEERSAPPGRPGAPPPKPAGGL